jgi:hypothetical protein
MTMGMGLSNPGCTDPPSNDVDLAWDERDGVIKKVLGMIRKGG